MSATPMQPLNARPAGEPLVWLTSMGLALALGMVVWLLIVIVANGASVFWPKRVQEYRLADGSAILAEQVRVQTRHDGGEEMQIFLGNKDVHGIAFRFVPLADIRSEAQPADVLSVERTEYGRALGHPLHLETPAGPVPAGDERFDVRLQDLIAEVAFRRAEILHLERDVIGANARAIERLERQRGPGSAERIAVLQAEYAALAAQAKTLRARQNENALVLRLADDRERRTATSLWTFLTEDPREANTEGGIFPAIFGTFVMTLLMSLAVTPFGVLAAIYLREYASQGPLVRAVRIAINNLAGVPSIVFGVFGLGFFVYLAGGSIDRLLFADRLPSPTFGTGGVLWAACTLALMTVPVVIVATEEAIAAVPRGAREGSLALGASKWQTVQRIILPAAVPGILTGLILAMARGAGEVAPLMLVGVVKAANGLPMGGTWNDTDLIPFVHLDQKFMHLGFHIYDLGFQSPDSDAAKPMVFATTFFLIMLVLALNLAAIILRDRLRRRFATSAF
jgi:phosphate transport system permease protein